MKTSWLNGAAGIALACVAASCGGESSRPPVSTIGFDVPSSDATMVPEQCEGGSVCSGACVDLQTNPRNCGACGSDCTRLPHVSSSGAACVAGRCVVAGACEPGWLHCSDDPRAGCEAAADDPTHCGACITTCPSERPLCRLTAPPMDAGAQTDASLGDVVTVDVPPTLATGRFTCGNDCMAGQSRCGMRCIDLQTDPARCGACDAVPCPAGANASPACTAGACGLACGAGFDDCDGMTANGCETATATSVAHCGACRRACPMRANATPTCAAGVCGSACATGFADCDGDAENGCEVDLRNDPSRCGGCGVRCATPPNAAPTCAAGVCGMECSAGFGNCDAVTANGCEVDTRAAATSCGACGTVCAVTGNREARCVAGACGSGDCLAGFADCDGAAANGCEVDTRSSVDHCGACLTVCPARPSAAPTCAASTCGVTCATGAADCDGNPTNGCEVNTQTAVAHCGACGNACPARPNALPTCAAGACGIACAVGTASCDGNPTNGCEVDTLTSAANCGACGHACPAIPDGRSACVSAVCTATCDPGRTFDGTACLLAPPQMISPMSTAIVTSRRPTLRWGPITGFDAVRVELFSDRPCTRSLGSFEVNATSGRPTTDLPVGVAFWRLRGLSGGAVASGPSPVWQLLVRAHGGTVDTAWGTVPDFNGDGLSDVVLGSQGQVVFVHYGRRPNISATPDLTLAAPSGSLLFGFAVASVGDINGDGFADLAVGARGSSRLYVYPGGPSGLLGAPSITLVGPPTLNFGFTVSAAGDLNHDGFGDFAVGMPGDLMTAAAGGSVFVFHGRANFPATGVTANQVISAPAGNAPFGFNVASAGDTDGDNDEEILIGSPFAPAIFPNAAFLYSSSGSAFLSSPTMSWSTPPGSPFGSLATFFGYPAQQIGDFDGNGFADVAIAASQSGYLDVFRGRPAGLPSVADLRIQNGRRDFARSVSCAGDGDGDGYDDLLVGTDRTDHAYFIPGGAAGLRMSGSVRLQGEAGRDFGYTVASPGDINGDGFSDTIIGEFAGSRALVYMGSSAGLGTTAAVTITGPASSNLSFVIAGL